MEEGGGLGWVGGWVRVTGWGKVGGGMMEFGHGQEKAELREGNS